MTEKLNNDSAIDSPVVARLKCLLLETTTECLVLKGEKKDLVKRIEKLEGEVKELTCSASATALPHRRPLRHSERYGPLKPYAIEEYGLEEAIKKEKATEMSSIPRLWEHLEQMSSSSTRTGLQELERLDIVHNLELPASPRAK